MEKEIDNARERAWKLEQELAQILHQHNEEVRYLQITSRAPTLSRLDERLAQRDSEAAREPRAMRGREAKVGVHIVCS